LSAASVIFAETRVGPPESCGDCAFHHASLGGHGGPAPRRAVFGGLEYFTRFRLEDLLG